MTKMNEENPYHTRHLTKHEFKYREEFYQHRALNYLILSEVETIIDNICKEKRLLLSSNIIFRAKELTAEDTWKMNVYQLRKPLPAFTQDEVKKINHYLKPYIYKLQQYSSGIPGYYYYQLVPTTFSYSGKLTASKFKKHDDSETKNLTTFSLFQWVNDGVEDMQNKLTSLLPKQTAEEKVSLINKPGCGG